MDSKVKRIRPKDYELSTVQDNLANAVDQLLGQANGTVESSPQLVLSPQLQQLRGAGTPYSLQAPALQIHGDTQSTGGSIVVIGDPATSTLPQYNAPVKLYGSLSATGPIVSDGTIAANSVQALSVTSQSGFKSYIDMGTQWRQSTQGGIVRAYRPVINTVNSSPAYVFANAYMPFSGSIVGISALMTNTITADVTLQVFKNNMGGTTGQIIDTTGIKANNSIPSSPITFAKGTYAFNAGDYLGMGCYVGTGYSFSIQFGLIVEFGA